MKAEHVGGAVRHNPSSAPIDDIDLREIESTFYVYILASDRHEKLAVSTTQDIVKRVREQRCDLHPQDYTSVHAVHILVHVEKFDDLCEAMNRYNHLRNTDHDELRELVDDENPDWRDLYSEYAGLRA